MMDIPFEQVKSDMVSSMHYEICGAKILIKPPQRSGRAAPSYTSTLLDSHREPDGSIAPDDEEDIKGSAGTLFAGNFHIFFRFMS